MPANASELARLLECSRQLISSHRRKPGAPPLADVSGWEEFLAAYGREGSMPRGLRERVARERLRLLAAIATKAERENTKAAGKSLDAGEVNTAIQRGMALLFGTMEREFGSILPPALVGLTSSEIASKLGEAMERFKAALRTGWGELAASPERPLMELR